MSNLLIIGAGNYGFVARETALNINDYSKIDFLDDNNDCAIGKFEEYLSFTQEYDCAFVALGNPIIRKEWFSKLFSAGFNMIKLISPYSYVSPSAIVEEGCIIEPKSVVNTSAVIRRGTLVCAGSVVNHNSVVNEFCHIDCGAVVGANTVIEPYTKINYNQVIYK